MKHLILIVLIQISSNTFSQIQFVGFDRNICPEPMSNTYSYNNFSNGGGGSGTIYGYTINKNGIAVFSDSGTMGDGKHCKDLIFINDSIGFLVYYSGNSSNRVLRTENSGQTWSNIGGGAPNYFGIYIINSNTAYLVTQWNTPLQLYVARCSNLPLYVNPTFISDQTIISDVFKIDTLLNADLCNIDSLNIFILNGIDTITYHINFISLNTGTPSSFSLQKTINSVYPNPSTGIFRIDNSDYEINSIRVYDLPGQVVYSKIRMENTTNTTIDLSGLNSGLYFIEIASQNKVFKQRIIIEK